MRILLFILFFPLCSFAQYERNEKLPYRATVISDTGTIQGYFVQQTDSAVFLSVTNRYSGDPAIKIPVNTIRELHLKDKTNRLGIVAGVTVLGFILTAGIIQNNDYDNNGKTSFFELIWSAIEGTTSKNRQRRVASLIAGTVGGATFMLVSIFTNKNFSLVFPLNNRNNFYTEKRSGLYKFIKF